MQAVEVGRSSFSYKAPLSLTETKNTPVQQFSTTAGVVADYCSLKYFPGGKKNPTPKNHNEKQTWFLTFKLFLTPKFRSSALGHLDPCKFPRLACCIEAKTK